MWLEEIWAQTDTEGRPYENGVEGEPRSQGERP